MSRPNDVDLKVAANIRQRRIMLGLTQQQMGELIGVTYQQTHKYETGGNRITSYRLWRCAKALSCSIGDLFDGVEDASAPAPPKAGQREVIELVQSYLRLGRGHRDAVRQLTNRLSDFEYEQPEREHPGIDESFAPPRAQSCGGF